MILSGIITFIVFLIILSILVLIHEAGHYFVAKKFGIKVEEFGFGFPLTKAIWQVKKGETYYSFYPVLIGGFVKLYGEDEAGAGRIETKKEVKKDKDEHRAFYNKPLWQRVLVVVAGVFMNVVLAVVVYYGYLGIKDYRESIPLIGNPPPAVGATQEISTKISVAEIAKNSPAEKAGITPFSLIESINGVTLKDEDTFGRIVKENLGRPVTVVWLDQKNKKHTATLTPRVNPPKNQGAIGIAFSPARTMTWAYETPVQKAFSGISHPINLMTYNFTALGYLIDVSVKEKDIKPVSQGVSGPIGIGVIVGQVLDIPDLQQRILTLLNLVGLLSISLAFVNILPIPGLDGGRFFFMAIEAVIRRKLDPKVEGYIHAAGMVFLLALLFLVSIKDIGQFFVPH